MGVRRHQMYDDMINLESQANLEGQASSIMKSLTKMNAMIEVYKDLIAATEAKLRRAGHGRPARSNAVTARLRKKLFSNNQEDLCHDVLITNVPEISLPLEQVVVVLAQFFGVKMKESEVVIAMRIGSSRRPGPIDPLERRAPRPIVARLANYVHRATLLHNSRSRRHECDEVVISQQIYIKERLTSKNDLLLQKTRNVARVAGWLHVRVKDGKIYVRCAIGDDLVHIRHVRDLYELCKSKAPQLLEPRSGGYQDDGEDSDSSTSSTASD